MIRILPQLFTAYRDQIVDIQRLPVNIGRPEKVLLLLFKIGHHLWLCLRKVWQVFLDLGAGAVLPLSMWLCGSSLHRRRIMHSLCTTIFVLALFTSEGCSALKHGCIRITANFPSSRVRWCWLINIKTWLNSRRVILSTICWPLCQCWPIFWLVGFSTLILTYGSNSHIIITLCTISCAIIRSILLLVANSLIILMIVIRHAAATAAWWLLVVVPLRILSIIIWRLWHVQLRHVAWGATASGRATLHMTITQRNINRPKPNRWRLIQIPISASAINRRNLRKVRMVQILSFHHLWRSRALCAEVWILIVAGRDLLVRWHVRINTGNLILVCCTLRLHALFWSIINLLGLLLHKVRIWKVLGSHLEGARCCLLLLVMCWCLLLLSFSTLLRLCLILLS